MRLLIRKEPTGPDTLVGERIPHIRWQDSTRRLPRHDRNTICADLLDYIYRDWYHVGKPRPFDDRLFHYMEVRPRYQRKFGEIARAQPTDQFVIFLGKPPKLRSDAVSHILELLEWRYSLAETVLFHRTKLAAAAMLDRALYELWGMFL